MKKKVLFTQGMSEDRMLIITDAPKKEIEKWCKNYNREQENGKNTYFDGLKKNFFVKVVYDSGEDFQEDVIDAIGYEEYYDLNDFL